MLWKRKKKETMRQVASSFFTDVLVQLHNKLLYCAAYLQNKSNSLPPQKQKLLLGVFCLLFISSSAFVIISNLKEKRQAFHITPIQVMPLEKRPVQKPMITTDEFLRIHRLRLVLDSMAGTSSGKIRLDSLLLEHPKLLDTLMLLESIYYQQHKK